MNAKTMVPLVVALVLGLVAAKLGRDMILKRRAEQAKVKLVRLVMAADDVAPGSVIGEEQVTLAGVPVEGAGAGVSQYAFTRPSDVVGRVAMTQIVKGQPILETLLAPKGSGGGAQAMIPEGMRAVTLEVNEFSGVAGLLVPGCQVDVVQTLKLKGDPDNNAEGGMMARTIVENLRVLAVGRRTSAAAPKGPEAEQAARSVTVLVTQEQAELIDLATHLGQPRLILRNGLDKRITGGKGITLAELRKRDGEKSEGHDPLAGIVGRLFGGNPAATRPVEATAAVDEKYTPGSATASNWR